MGNLNPPACLRCCADACIPAIAARPSIRQPRQPTKKRCINLPSAASLHLYIPHYYQSNSRATYRRHGTRQ